jgi:hypothetical protein
MRVPEIQIEEARHWRVMATRVEHVERISGKGRLTAGENVYTVDYVINIYQRYAESTPLPRFARGRLTG